METQDRIVVKSMEMFFKYGIRAVTMDRIAGEMGISKRTIYESFHDKDALLLEGLKYFAGRQKAETGELLRISDHVIEAIFRFTARQAALMREINPQFIHDLRKYHEAVYRQFTQEHDLRDYSLTEDFLRRGIREGIFRPAIHIGIVNRFLHVLLSVFGPDCDPSMKEFSHSEIFENVFLAYIRGISTNKGLRLIEKYHSLSASGW